MCLVPFRSLSDSLVSLSLCLSVSVRDPYNQLLMSLCLSIVCVSLSVCLLQAVGGYSPRLVTSRLWLQPALIGLRYYDRTFVSTIDFLQMFYGSNLRRSTAVSQQIRV